MLPSGLYMETNCCSKAAARFCATTFAAPQTWMSRANRFGEIPGPKYRWFPFGHLPHRSTERDCRDFPIINGL
jgi:hypothetical protein